MRLRVLLGAVAGSLITGTVGAQSSQQTVQQASPSTSAAGEELEEVTVSGVRASLENAIQTKRLADTVIDAISAEDIDKFPTEDKEPTADLEEGGLAGTVIARTARPLDFGRRKLAGAIEEADDSHRNEWAPRASAFYSDVFADGQLGIALLDYVDPGRRILLGIRGAF
jgi:hypothetical protein